MTSGRPPSGEGGDLDDVRDLDLSEDRFAGAQISGDSLAAAMEQAQASGEQSEPEPTPEQSEDPEEN